MAMVFTRHLLATAASALLTASMTATTRRPAAPATPMTIALSFKSTHDPKRRAKNLGQYSRHTARRSSTFLRRVSLRPWLPLTGRKLHLHRFFEHQQWLRYLRPHWHHQTSRCLRRRRCHHLHHPPWSKLHRNLRSYFLCRSSSSDLYRVPAPPLRWCRFASFLTTRTMTTATTKLHSRRFRVQQLPNPPVSRAFRTLPSLRPNRCTTSDGQRPRHLPLLHHPPNSPHSLLSHITSSLP